METIDFMDFKQRRRHSIMLMIGYVLIGSVIVTIAAIFLFLAYGYNYKNGHVIQNGLVYISSTPNPAQIYVNGALSSSTTNTSILLPAGTYDFRLNLSGYRNWQRSIIVPGGQIVYYQYPFLIPNKLVTTTLQTYATAPSIVTQSPSQQWLVVSQPGSLTSFDLYNLNNTPVSETSISLPSGLLSPAVSSQSLEVVQWANDNSHLLLKHVYDGNTEYILMDINNPSQSLNLTKNLNLPTSGISLSLSNEQYDQYFVLDSSTQTLSQASLSTPQLQAYVNDVLAYKSYGSNTILYATPDPTNSAEVDINLYDGTNTYTIRHDVANTTYLLDLTTYNGNLYVAIAASSENRAYIYENPVSQINNPQMKVAVPIEEFNITAPNYVSFSPNAQYILFENGASFAVYDAENALGYDYTVPDPMDAPQVNASWMSIANLVYVSNGKLITFDFDGSNLQTLVPADSRYTPYFNSNYQFLYTLTPSISSVGQELLTSTSLLVP